MTESLLKSVPWPLVAAAVVVGLVGGVGLPRVVPHLSGLLAGGLAGATCAATVVGVRSDRGHRGTVALALFVEALRLLVFFVSSVALLAVAGLDVGQDAGFVAFSVLVGSGAVLALGVVSLPVAAVVGGVTSVASDAVRR